MIESNIFGVDHRLDGSGIFENILRVFAIGKHIISQGFLVFLEPDNNFNIRDLGRESCQLLYSLTVSRL